MKKSLIAGFIAGALVFSMAGTGFAANTDKSYGSEEIVAGVLDLLSGLADSSGKEAGGQEKAGSANELSDLLSGIVGSAGGAADQAEAAQDGESSGLESLSGIISGIADSSGDAVDSNEVNEVINGIEGFLSGLADSNGETADTQEAAGQTEDLSSGIGENAGTIAGTYEESDIPMIYWEEAAAEIEAEGLEGSFITFDEVGLQLWIPDFLTSGVLPEGQEGADTFIGYYTSDDDSCYASVQYVPTDITLDDYRELLESLGDEIEGPQDYMINGLPFLLYFIPAADNMCLSTVVEGKGLVEFAFAPVSDGDFEAFAEIMGISIQPIE